MVKTIHVKETDSTNNWLKGYQSEAGEDMTVVTTDYQSAGRGCGSNQWESEAGKNLMFSILLHPKVSAKDQFILSMANALALKDQVAERYLLERQEDWRYTDRDLTARSRDQGLHHRYGYQREPTGVP